MRATIEEMLIFKRIVEAGSLSKAAEQLDMAKSAVSRRLKMLEARLSVNLLQRTTRRQILTEAGEHYYRNCIRLLDDIAEVESQVSGGRSEINGRLRIAVPLSFGLDYLSPVLLSYQADFPNVSLDIDFSDQHVDLVAGGFDLAIRIGQLPDSSLRARRLSYTRLLICASPTYLEAKGMPKTPEDLRKNHVALHYYQRHENWPFIDSGKRVDVVVDSIMQANNGQFLCHAAKSHLGLIRAPDFICHKAISSGELIKILSDYYIENHIGIYAVTPGHHYLPKRCEMLIDYIQSAFRQKTPWLEC
ncbi:Transcriptional regulator, LysR family [Methylophaga frappieri]|uniref:Transcriptional regulator, LysR family n=2 Tax=Methylophaga frappieri (strain ATCC BAA-2434 / DSM 25690 / JAM7) TaxID=754477 RepID=I1YES7_METFJ|nr:Transcriptional regulator, LysR family [Methylophaga frappieri]